MNEPLIAVTGLSKVYPMGTTTVQALRGVSFTIASGEFVALMGASGSGKTTLLHLLGCLDKPTVGQYWLSGQEMSTLSVAERAAPDRPGECLLAPAISCPTRQHCSARAGGTGPGGTG